SATTSHSKPPLDTTGHFRSGPLNRTKRDKPGGRSGCRFPADLLNPLGDGRRPATGWDRVSRRRPQHGPGRLRLLLLGAGIADDDELGVRWLGDAVDDGAVELGVDGDVGEDLPGRRVEGAGAVLGS